MTFHPTQTQMAMCLTHCLTDLTSLQRCTTVRTLPITLIALTLISLVHLPAFGHGGGGDIALFTTGEQVGVGFAVLDDDDINQISFDPNDHVFSSILVPQVLFGFSMGSTEPGFDADEGLLPEDASVNVSTMSVRYWDGSGSVAFTDTGVSAAYSPSTMQTDNLGGFHAHPLFGLAGDVANGVYLTEMTVSAGDLASSDSFYLVSLVDDIIANHTDPESAGEDLGELVRNYQADPTQAPVFEAKDFSFFGDAVLHVESQVVPEPAGSSMVVLSILMLASLRRSRRSFFQS